MVAPVVVEPLVVELLPLLACLVALALILVSRQLASALFGVAKSAVGWIPWLGSKVKGSLVHIEQRINNYMSDVVDGLQGRIGAYFHALGNTLLSLGNELLGAAEAIAKLAWYVTGKWPIQVLFPQIGALRRLVDFARHRVKAVIHALEWVEKQVRHAGSGTIGGAIHGTLRPLTARIGRLERWSHSEVKWLGHEVAVDLPHDIAGLRARDLSLSRLYERLWARVKRLDKLTGALALSGVVAVALGRLGGGWIRCSNWRKVGRIGCRMPLALIEAILGAGLDALVLADLCAIATLVERAVEQLEPGIRAVLDVADGALCGGRYSGPPDLPLNRATLPPVRNAVAL